MRATEGGEERCGSESDCGRINIFISVYSGTAEMQMDSDVEDPAVLTRADSQADL